MKRHWKTLIVIGLLLVGMLILPLLVSSPRWITIGSIIFYNIILASSWNLIMGYTGIFSFGHMGVTLLGGYATALLTLSLGLPPWVAFLCGGLAGALANFLLGALCLRFKGFYLTLVTWAFAEMTIAVLNNEYEITGGSMGIMAEGIFDGSGGNIANYYLGLVLVLIFIVGLRYMMRSRIGIYLQSVRDDEEASEVMGVNTVFWKIFSFTFSGFWAGLAGAYYLNFMGVIDPTAGNLMELGNVMLMVILGGIGTLAGPVIGAVFVVMASQLLVGFESMSMMFFAILMIVILRYFRGGIVGGLRKLNERLQNPKRAAMSKKISNKEES